MCRTAAIGCCLLLAGGAAGAQEGDAAYNCQMMIANSGVMVRPEMQETYRKPGVTIQELVARIVGLAESGVGVALYTVGLMLQNGYCMEKNLPLALQAHAEAADAGIAGSQRILALNYALGKSAPQVMRLDVAQDLVLGYMWFTILDDQSNLQQLRRTLSAAQIAEAEKRAGEWSAKRRKK